MDPNIDPQHKSDPSKFTPKNKNTKEDIDHLFQTVTCSSISKEDKITILEQAVAPCPEIEIQLKTKTLNHSSTPVQW